MNDRLQVLADKLGIATSFSDSGTRKQTYAVSEDIVRFFCRELGYSAQNDDEVEKSIKAFDDKAWKQPFENMVVMRQEKPEIYFVLPFSVDISEISVDLYEKESRRSVELSYFLTLTGEEKNIGRQKYRRWRLVWQDEVPLGYYEFELHVGKEAYQTILAVTPMQCYTTSDVESGCLFGFSLQLYALKSRRNWGVGDFTDLKNFAKLVARYGADVIGLNPLNPLFHDFPENASPYNSVSRLFLNPIYIDVEQVPCYHSSVLPDLKMRIAMAKKGEYIDYTKVYNLKIEILHQLFKSFPFSSAYEKAFQKFEKEKGWDLEIFATYQALYHEQCQCVWGGCRAWAPELQNPNGLAVEKFRKTHQKEIKFFKFLQFEAERQFEEVNKTVRACGLKIGLYRDLPVGVCKDSAEFWCDRGAFMPQSGAGAPPDAFFQNGQKWCLGAFSPFALKQRAYEPFLKVLRANMQGAGALRIDHVMGLMRLFMIPDHKEEGTYISYAFEDMLGLVALESRLNHCVIVGESIGNVPEGFMDKLFKARIYSISVLWSERWQHGEMLFKMPCDYMENAFVSVGTHDMPPLKMWWFGDDIELSYRFHMIADETRRNLYYLREADRKKLLDALDYNKVWPTDHLRKGDYLFGEGYPEGLEEAVHRFLGASCSRVVLLQLEDIFQVQKQQNLPGTDYDKYPNWRLKLPIDLEDYETNTAFERNIKMVRLERKR